VKSPISQTIPNGQRVDAAQAAQPRDQRSPRSARGRLIERTFQLLDPPVEQIDRVKKSPSVCCWA